MKTNRGKTTKITPAVSEECGIWLDTAELRRKKEQKRMTRPIIKLLNPLARPGGYSSAVSLSFTQTKMQMPVTRQSTISSFFTPQSISIEGDSSPASPPVMSSTPFSQAYCGTKRKRQMSPECPSELDNVRGEMSQSQDSDSDFERGPDKDCEDRQKEQHFVHLLWGYQSEECEPAEKRRRPAETVIENVTETQQESNTSKVPRRRTANDAPDIHETLIERSQQDSLKDSYDIHGTISFPAKGFHSQEPLKARVLTERNNSNQRPVLTRRSDIENQHMKHPSKSHKELAFSGQKCDNSKWSVEKQDKENNRPTSPRHSDEPANLKWQLSASPTKILSNIKIRSFRSPKKPIRTSLENERDSLAMLFTQDSEGFRVIANRDPGTRWPLMDVTNSTEDRDYWNIPSVKSIETDESSDLEPEMLFTQDSQGNMVIRH